MIKDDDTPVPSDNENDESDYKERRKSLLNQMSLPQVLRDKGMTSLPGKVSCVSTVENTMNFPSTFRMTRTLIDKVGPALISGLLYLMM